MIDLRESIHYIYKSYMRALPHLHGYDAQTRDPDVMRRFFRRIGLPTNRLPTLAITGSKGKGSTALLASALLEAAGRKTGLVTSPHLVNFCERIRVDGRAIPDEKFQQLISRLAPEIDSFDAGLPPGKFLGPTGLLLAVAQLYFEEEGVEVQVLEAGRGGRFDDTSIMDNQVTCLSPVMGEHLDKLGPAISDVAWNKIGLVKPGSMLVSAPQSLEVTRVVEAEIRRLGARWVVLGRDLQVEASPSAPGEQRITVSYPARDFEHSFHLRSAAGYLATNLAVAAGGVVELFPASLPEFGRRDLRRFRLPGRGETIHHLPTVIVDGAINRQSAAEFLNSSLPHITRPLILVTALPKDKDARGLLETLAPVADRTIVTRVDNPVLQFTDEVSAVARQVRPDSLDLPVTAEAFRQAGQMAGERGTIWIVGTQSLVREALAFWEQNLDQLWG